MEDIVLAGFGGHAKSVIDSIERGGKYRIAGFTETHKCPEYHGYSCLGTDDELDEIYKNTAKKAFVCIGYMGTGDVRESLYARLKTIGFALPTICDPSAAVSEASGIGEGTYVGKNAVVNAGASVGKMCIINTSSVIEHDVCVGDYSHIAVGTVLCGQVRIGERCLVGANATVIQGITIGNNVIIGAGSVVLRDIQDNEKVYGVVK